MNATDSPLTTPANPCRVGVDAIYQIRTSPAYGCATGWAAHLIEREIWIATKTERNIVDAIESLRRWVNEYREGVRREQALAAIDAAISAELDRAERAARVPQAMKTTGGPA